MPRRRAKHCGVLTVAKRWRLRAPSQCDAVCPETAMPLSAQRDKPARRVTEHSDAIARRRLVHAIVMRRIGRFDLFAALISATSRNDRPLQSLPNPAPQAYGLGHESKLNTICFTPIGRLRPALLKTSGRQVQRASSPAWVRLRVSISDAVASDCRGPSRVSNPPDRGDRPSRFDESNRLRTSVLLPLPDRPTPGPSLQGSAPLQPRCGDRGRFRMSVGGRLPDSGWMPIARAPPGTSPLGRPSHRTRSQAGSSIKSVGDCAIGAVAPPLFGTTRVGPEPWSGGSNHNPTFAPRLLASDLVENWQGFVGVRTRVKRSSRLHVRQILTPDHLRNRRRRSHAKETPTEALHAGRPFGTRVWRDQQCNERARRMIHRGMEKTQNVNRPAYCPGGQCGVRRRSRSVADGSTLAKGTPTERLASDADNRKCQNSIVGVNIASPNARDSRVERHNARIACGPAAGAKRSKHCRV